GLAYSPNGKLLAASSGDSDQRGGVIIWDPVTGERLWECPEVLGYSPTVAFSPDGSRLATLGNDWNIPTLKIWDRRPGTTPVAIRGTKGEMGWVSVAFSPDGNSIATASGTRDEVSPENQPGEVKIWDSRTGELIATLPHPGPLTCVAFSPDSKHPLLA